MFLNSFTLIACVVAAIGLTSEVRSQDGQAESTFGPKPRRPWVLEGGNVVTLSPPSAVRSAADPYVDGSSFKGVAADLNRDGTDDYILQGHRDECGTGGCSYWIFNGATAKLIGN